MKWIAFEKSVGAVIFRRENGIPLYLLLHYPSGHWDFPKGHVEQGETEEETLRRELEEETGIKEMEVIPGFRTKVRYWYKAKGRERERRMREGRGIFIIKKVVYYAGETSESQTRLSFEHVGCGWFSYEEALRRITHDNSRLVLMRSRQASDGS